jgi:hypothetical protein
MISKEVDSEHEDSLQKATEIIDEILKDVQKFQMATKKNF